MPNRSWPRRLIVGLAAMSAGPSLAQELQRKPGDEHRLRYNGSITPRLHRDFRHGEVTTERGGVGTIHVSHRGDHNRGLWFDGSSGVTVHERIRTIELENGQEETRRETGFDVPWGIHLLVGQWLRNGSFPPAYPEARWLLIGPAVRFEGEFQKGLEPQSRTEDDHTFSWQQTNHLTWTLIPLALAVRGRQTSEKPALLLEIGYVDETWVMVYDEKRGEQHIRQDAQLVYRLESISMTLDIHPGNLWELKTGPIEHDPFFVELLMRGLPDWQGEPGTDTLILNAKLGWEIKISPVGFRLFSQREVRRTRNDPFRFFPEIPPHWALGFEFVLMVQGEQ